MEGGTRTRLPAKGTRMTEPIPYLTLDPRVEEAIRADRAAGWKNPVSYTHLLSGFLRQVSLDRHSANFTPRRSKRRPKTWSLPKEAPSIELSFGSVDRAL